jgi:tetratricopeptide (TPR) repeat protein
LRILFGLFCALLIVQPAFAQTQSDSDICYDPNASDQATIAACTRVIQSGITGTKLSDAYNNRATGYINTNQDDLAFADENQAILYNPNNAQAYRNRGLLYYRKALIGSSIIDYTQAIRVKPDYANAFVGRGNSYFANNQSALAILDYNQAIQLDPNNTNAYAYRGYALVTTAKYDAAATDLQHAISLNPRLAYSVLWLHVARMRSGFDDKVEFGGNASSLSTTAWPGSIVTFYLGNTTGDGLLTDATTPNRRCEANFFYGEWLLAKRRNAEARTHFQTATQVCTVTFFEGPAARAELQRLP